MKAISQYNVTCTFIKASVDARVVGSTLHKSAEGMLLGALMRFRCQLIVLPSTASNRSTLKYQRRYDAFPRGYFYKFNSAAAGLAFEFTDLFSLLCEFTWFIIFDNYNINR